jgi:hypothetical protein
MEPGAISCIIQFDEWNLDGGAPMSSGSEFEEFARDCVRLATQANSPQLREKLFDIAREWMRAAMDGENARRSTPPASGGNTRQRLLTVDEPYAEKGIATDA